MSKLFDIAYVVAKEEMAFTKYPFLLELEKWLGVPIGNTYAADTKCKEFAMHIGKCFQGVINEINFSRYIAVLMDGSTDSSVTEKELIYVLLVKADGNVVHPFFA